MNADPKNAERRQHERYRAKEHDLVLIGTDTDGALYHIIDISKGGLSFSYIGESELTQQLSEISIIVGNTFCLDALPVVTVSDKQLRPGQIGAMRRRGVRFGKLSPSQESLMDEFLQRYAVCTA
jgi:hypothetical protein